MNKGAYHQGFERGREGKDSLYPFNADTDEYEYEDDFHEMLPHKRQDWLESYNQGHEDGKKKQIKT